MDYWYKEGDQIPVILGSEYNGIYSVGDTFTHDYLYKNYNFYVYGILNSCEITNMKSNIRIDQYIIMPSFSIKDIPQDIETINSMKIHYENKVSGIIHIEDESRAT